MQWTQEYLLKEVNSSLDKKRKLFDKLKVLENEVTVLTSPKSDKSPKKASPRSAPGKTSERLSNVSHGPAGRGKGQSGRGKRGASRGRNRKDNARNQEANETLDARIKSIITSALMFDDSSVNDGSKKSKLLTKNNGKNVQKDDSDKSRDKNDVGNHSLTLPMRLPLDNTDASSMPVSLPLSGLENEPKLAHLLTQNSLLKLSNQAKETSIRRSKQDMGMFYSSIQRVSKSPISRPSSSSSTASAESVKFLEHGTRVASVNPNCVVTSQIHSDEVKAHNVPVSGPSSQISSKGLLSAKTLSSVSKSYTVGKCSGYPHVGAMLLGGLVHNTQVTATEKDLCSKMLGGSTDLGSHMVNDDLVRINKLLPSEMSKSKRKQRRRQSVYKTGSGRGRLGSTMHRGSTRHEGEVPSLSRATPEVISMMSTASQPLAISAISDAESTKSSPLDKSPTKNICQLIQAKQKGIHTARSIPLFLL